MRNLIRQPLTLMVIAEFVVVALLMVLAWNLVVSASQRSGVGPMQVAGPLAQESISPQPEIPELARPAPKLQLPGLNLDAGFWRARLGQLNREQVSLEQLEWRVVHGAMDAAKRYVETVVLPAIVRAERAGG